MVAEPLRAVPTSTTRPHVAIVDLDFSFQKKWRDAIWKAVSNLASTLDGETKGYHKPDIDSGVDGWYASTSAGDDGYLLVRTQVIQTRRLRLKRVQGKPVLRITGVTGGINEHLRPRAIECLLYEPELTEQVREMMANLASELGVTQGLTLYRQSAPLSWEPITNF